MLKCVVSADPSDNAIIQEGLRCIGFCFNGKGAVHLVGFYHCSFLSILQPAVGVKHMTSGNKNGSSFVYLDDNGSVFEQFILYKQVNPKNSTEMVLNGLLIFK